MNLLQSYLVISTIALMLCGVCWNNNGTLNKVLKTVIFLIAVVGGFIALNTFGFALGPK